MMSTGVDPLPRVAVLLATYNGRKFIASQVRTLLNQALCVVNIWVSDDQSTDGTWEWLCERADIESRIFLLPRVERFGNAARNFYRLVREADFSSCEYVALADQDDIWFDDKLATSIRQLRERAVAAVSSDVIALWPNGRKSLIRKSQKQRRLDFLFESAGPGCTYVLTVGFATSFRQFLNDQRQTVGSIQFHDWMLYAWARAYGFAWHIQSCPTMYYRQHGGNEFGANKGLAALQKRIARVRAGWYREQILDIARLICRGPSYTPECAATISLVERRTFFSRVSLAAKVHALRRRTPDRVWLLLACVFGGI